jgi:hemolysin activation/secretion protein
MTSILASPLPSARVLRLGLAGALATACAFAPALAPAQTVPAPPIQQQPPLIQSVDVRGSNPLSADTTRALVAPFLQTPATLDSLAALTTALESALQAAGYSLYKVVLPPQTLGSSLQLEVVRFNLGQVDVRGNQHVDRANVLTSLPELTPGQSPNLQRLALQTRLANAAPHKQVRVGLRESATPDSVDANVTVQDHSPWLFGADMSNTGSTATGKDRITLLASHGNLFNRDHGLSAVWTTSAERPNDVQQWGLSYRIPLYTLGGTLNASLSQSDVTGRFGAFNSTGAGRTTQIGYTQLIPAAGNWTGEWSLNLNDRLFNGAQLHDANDHPIAGTTTPDTRSRSLNLGHAGTVEADGAAWAYNLSAATALSGGRGNDLAAYNNGGTNPAITTTHWTALRGNASLQATQLPLLPARWTLVLRGEFQASHQALIPGEQFGVGGANSVRGLPERSLQGDSGVQTTLELRGPELWPGLNLLGFVDTGWLVNNHPNATTRLESDQVTSTGLGLRWVHPAGLSLNLDYGRVVKGSQLPLANAPSAPRAGDDRLHLGVSMRF